MQIGEITSFLSGRNLNQVKNILLMSCSLSTGQLLYWQTNSIVNFILFSAAVLDDYGIHAAYLPVFLFNGKNDQFLFLVLTPNYAFFLPANHCFVNPCMTICFMVTTTFHTCHNLLFKQPAGFSTIGQASCEILY